MHKIKATGSNEKKMNIDKCVCDVSLGEKIENCER